MPGPYFPTNELVAVAWLSQRVPGLVAGQVATTLPRDATSWAGEGFVQVQALGAGTPDIYTYQRRPVVQVSCWAHNPNTNKPPWNEANRLAELIREATQDAQSYGRPVTLPASYLGARVLSVYLVSEPVRVNDDPAGYARFDLDLAIDWVRQ